MYINVPETLELIQQYHIDNQEHKEPQRLYAPRNYMMNMEGKKFRSLLCLLGYGLYRDDIEQALDMAYIVELFHNFTLVHDDIMDDATLRRGQLAAHHKYDINSAILTGDVMQIEVYDRLCNLPNADNLKILQAFNKMAREVCEGQSMDMEFEESDNVALSNYLKMIELKTAVLLGYSLQMGALLAGANESDQRHIYHFGINAGIGFQLQDDLLDVYGDPATFGKKVGGDIIQGKKTYLYLRALDLLTGEGRKKFKSVYSSNEIGEEQKIENVTAVFDELYIKNYCEEAKSAFFDLAKSHLTELSVSSIKKEQLIGFTETLLHREK